MTHFTSTQYFQRQLKEELERFDGSCPHPLCAGQGYYLDVESFVVHLKETHGIQSISTLTQEGQGQQEEAEKEEEPSLLHDERLSLNSEFNATFASAEAVTDIKPSAVHVDIADSFIDWPSPDGWIPQGSLKGPPKDSTFTSYVAHQQCSASSLGQQLPNLPHWD
jgi:hypothetical protein